MDATLDRLLNYAIEKNVEPSELIPVLRMRLSPTRSLLQMKDYPSLSPCLK